MALTAMSTVTNQILFQSGEVGPEYYRTNGTTIKPGMCVTKTVETIQTRNIDIPGAIDEVSAGIVGLLPDHDIDTAYADDVAVPVYTKGSGAVCWAWITAAESDQVQGAPLMHSHAGADGLLLAGELVNEYLGQAYRDVNVDGTDDTPALVWLQ